MTWTPLPPDPPHRSDVRRRVDELDKHVAREVLRRPHAWTWGVVWLALVLLGIVLVSWWVQG